MESNNSIKFYTPAIEDFYFGYECETKEDFGSKTNWQKQIITDEWGGYDDAFSLLIYYIERKNVRTKYLDEQDILSLNFKKEQSLREEVLAYIKNDYVICYLEDIHIVIISKRTKGFPNSAADYLFQGEIKSLNELKYLLKLLKIE